MGIREGLDCKVTTKLQNANNLVTKIFRTLTNYNTSPSFPREYSPPPRLPPRPHLPVGTGHAPSAGDERIFRSKHIHLPT